MRCLAVTGGLGIEFDPFLRSPLWKEKSGAMLSVLSALARLEVDPWQEAAALTLLPKDDASGRLSDLLAQLPEAQTIGIERDALCQRSVSLLPVSDVRNTKSAQFDWAANEKLPMPPQAMLLILGCMVAFGLIGSLIAARVLPDAAFDRSLVMQSASGTIAGSTAAHNK